jgi:signal-transduction protein with cAMP-binding, CBS, and nucleotidyltransferase domain
MSNDVKKASPDNTLMDIAAMMRDEDIGALPVVQDSELRGIITDRDIVVRAIAEGKDAATTTVEEVLSSEVESVQPDDDVELAADLMASRQIRRLPVVEDGNLIGVVSLGDISVKQHEESTAAHALEGVSEGVKASGAAQTGSRRAGAKSTLTATPHKATGKARAGRKKAA